MTGRYTSSPHVANQQIRCRVRVAGSGGAELTETQRRYQKLLLYGGAASAVISLFFLPIVFAPIASEVCETIT